MAKATIVFGLILVFAIATVFSVTVSPTLSTSYYANGLSGMYEWYGYNIAPLASRDAYARFSWRQLEPTQGNYDFSAINTLLADALSTGGKAGFRVMLADSYEGGKSVPDYFATSANGWTCTGISNNPWIPNWNGASLLTRLNALFDALAAQYANDARLSYLDIGLYGNYGEWHNAEFYDAGCFPGPNSWGEATYTRKNEFINLITSRFPNKFLVINTNDYDGLCIATSGNRLGLRGDTFSDASWTSSIGTGDQLFELMRRQYRVQPFISEFSTNPDFTKAKQHALEDHRTTVGNGNFPLWGDLSATQQNALLEAAKWIGPRITVSSATWNSPAAPGGCLTVSLTFINSGAARVYEKWSTLVQLRSGATVSYQTPTSIADIRNVMPTNDGMPSWTESNSFTIPETLAAGTYSVVLLVKDMTGYRPNYRLAITPQNSDDTYTLGTITISASASIPATCVTRTAWAGFTQPKYLIGSGANSWNDHPIGPIYTDFLMFGWAEELNGATGNIANTSPVYSGTKSIAFTTTRTYGIWGMAHICTVNLSGYTYVHFRMLASAGASGTPVFFYPFMSPWNNPPQVLLSNYGGNPVSSGWKNYNIPLSAFAGLPTQIDHLVWGGYNNGATFYIDDISFSDTTIP